MKKISARDVFLTFQNVIYSGMRRKKNMDHFENNLIANEKISKPLIARNSQVQTCKKVPFSS